MKNIGNLFVRLFVVSLLVFRYFSTIVSLFGAGGFLRLRLRLRLRTNSFGGSGSGSGSGQNVSAPAAPAPAPASAPHPWYYPIKKITELIVLTFRLSNEAFNRKSDLYV